MPVAVISWATTPKQKVVVSTLENVVRDSKGVPAPAVTIVGEVVRRRAEFWGRPLEGKKILVTRPAGDAEGFACLLEKLGAVCVHLPMIEIRPRRLAASERKGLIAALPRYDWIIFTSHHGVDGLARIAASSRGCSAMRHSARPGESRLVPGLRLARPSGTVPARLRHGALPSDPLGGPLSGLIRAKVVVIGPRTLAAVQAAGLEPALVPSEFSTEGLRAVFRRVAVKGKRVLIPRSNLGVRDELARDLRRRGAVVDEPVIYETVNPEIAPAVTRKALQHIDAVAFTSASTVAGFVKAIRRAKLPMRAAVNGAQVAAIGPATAKALEAAGIRKFHLPKNGWTVDGLVDAVTESLS